MLTDAKSIASSEIKKEEISPYWSFNETADISKYEDFDHKKFLGKHYDIINTLNVYIHNFVISYSYRYKLIV